MEKKHTINLLKALALIFVVLFVDQASKIWVKTNMQLYESIRVTDWFYISFIENNGMAFGLELFGKLFLTLFRLAAAGAIGYYLVTIIRKNMQLGYVLIVALIFAGAMGNIIDSVFYGIIFDHSYGQLATLFPPDGGYGTLFNGKVVDMFYFPFFSTVLPDWLPFFGGKEFLFFQYIFNVADSAVCVGFFTLILFYRNALSTSLETPKQPKGEVPEK